jgi:tRNA threonylcarbamoyladenosine biosynthesis protein TsaB
MENNYILGIETSTQHCSVALFNQGKLLASRLLTEEGSHSKMLTILIEQVCLEVKISLNKLHAVAVSNGPGSYTGLRIGLSTAKGLCYGNDIPLICLPTLHILAEAAREKYPNQQLLPMLDARRMEVYTCLINEKGEELLPTQAKILSNDFLALETNPIIAFGNGSGKWKESCANPLIQFDPDFDFPNATSMGKMAQSYYLNKKFENLVTIEPQYLKEFMGTTPKKLI